MPNRPKLPGMVTVAQISATNGGPRVVVVDDDEGVRQSIADLLRTDGYHVAEAADADAAVRLLAEGDPSLLVLDLGLERTGLELLDRVDSPPPVILMSGSPENVPTDPRVSVFLTKPIPPKRLLAEVARCVGT